MHEGLAEYTGVALRGTNLAETRAAHAVRMLAPMAEGGWVRGFAYRSGPAYGLLLDACGARWRAGLTARSDLGELLRAALAFELPADAAAEVEHRGARYGSAELRAAEQRAAAELAARRVALRALLVERPVLELELARPNIGFDTNAVVSLDAEGTVYLGGKLVDAWGTLETDEPLRVSWPAMRAWITAPPEAATEGRSWKLALAPGWKLAPGARPGDLRAVRGER